jgi:hypothetical protein
MDQGWLNAVQPSKANKYTFCQETITDAAHPLETMA